MNSVNAPGSVSTSIRPRLLDRLDFKHTPHPRQSNPHSPRRATYVPTPAVSSLGGLRAPAPCPRRHLHGAASKTFTEAAITRRSGLQEVQTLSGAADRECLYYFFMVVVIIRYKTKATAC